jgi:lysophospholipase L1-like esterase
MTSVNASIPRPHAPRRILACVAALLVATSAAPADDGPSPYPSRAEEWPGVGVVRVFGWMTENRRAFWRQREKARNSIVLAGDSLLASWKDLANAFPSERIANRAIGGDVSRGLLFRFEEDVLALDPSAILILIGTNDLTARQKAELTIANVRTMIEMAHEREPETLVILCTVPPSANPKAPVDERERRALNDGLRTLARTHEQVTLVDLFAALADEQGAPDPQYFRADLLHLSPPGHARLGELVSDALRQTRRAPRS